MTHEYESIHLTSDPIANLQKWLKEATDAGVPEPTAMALATATKDGAPSVRIVLFKDLSEPLKDGRRAPRFFTNYESRKSRELLENPRASVVFFWAPLNRQVRIEGRIEKATPAESFAYYQSRPQGSRVGAWASPQSRPIKTRAELLALVKKIEERFAGQELPLPPHWGGWRLIPERFEFWQAGEYRLHDRFVFEWNGRDWTIQRLAP